MKSKECSGCGNSLDAHNDGIELWGSWFCSSCFIGNATKLHKELTADDIKLLRQIGRELAGFLPPELLEMVIIGFLKRAQGLKDSALRLEVSRCIGEIQRLTAFATFQQIMKLLKVWQGTFEDFVQNQEAEIRDKIKKLTDLEPEGGT